MATRHYLTFTLDDQSYALGIDAVERVLRAVQLTRVPEAPETLLGLINVHGAIVPVLNIRRRFNLPQRPLTTEDRMILFKTPGKPTAIIVDKVEGVVALDTDDVRLAREILPDMEELVEGVGFTAHHTVLIYDIDRLFSGDDIQALDAVAG